MVSIEEAHAALLKEDRLQFDLQDKVFSQRTPDQWMTHVTWDGSPLGWGVVAVAMLPFLGTLEQQGRTWWLWTALAGFGLGLIGIEYCRRRKNALRLQPAGRRRKP